MSARDLTDMAQVTAALFEAEQAKLRDLLQREAELRRALDTLDRHRRDASSLPPSDLNAPRAVGADLLWQGWVGRKRAELNTQLAQVLVRKAGRMADLRRAFGRKAAIDRLCDDARLAAQKAARKRDDETVQGLALIRPGD